MILIFWKLFINILKSDLRVPITQIFINFKKRFILQIILPCTITYQVKKLLIILKFYKLFLFSIIEIITKKFLKFSSTI